MPLITWSETTVTVNVGETATVNFSYGKELELMFTVTTSDASVATIATSGNPSGFSGVATITGVSAGTTVTVPGGVDTQNAPLTITVVEADDEEYLNKRGLTHFWENIDDIKQNKLTAGTGILINNDVISATGGGTADAVDWGHITGSMSNQTDLTTALAAKANSADLATVATSGDYDDLTDKPTIGNATLTIQKNGTSAGTFTANATSNKTINITVPTTAADVSALPASTKYGASIAVSINTTDYKVTTALKDQDGNTLGTAQVIDLPLESVVVNGSYDSTNKKIVLTLQNGNTIDIPVADLVAGLQSEITSTNKLASDLVDDANQTHKFVTAAQITKLNGIAAGAEVNVQSDWDQTTTTADDYIKNKPSIPAKTSDLTNDSGFITTSALSGYLPLTGGTLTGKLTGTQIETGTAAANYFQSQKFRGQGDASTYYHAIDFGYGGHDQVDFYEYGGVWNFWKNTSATATTNTNNLALGITLNALKNKSYTYTFPNKTGTFALTSDLPTVNNGTLTIQKNGTSVATFTANQSGNATANITVPTIDDVVEIDKTLAAVTDWTNTGIQGADLATGTYAVQVYTGSSYANTWQERWSGIMSWYSGNTNSSNTEEILLHNAGHADNSQNLFLRTKRDGVTVDGTKYLTLQYAFSQANETTTTIKFYFRRII